MMHVRFLHPAEIEMFDAPHFMNSRLSALVTAFSP